MRDRSVSCRVHPTNMPRTFWAAPTLGSSVWVKRTGRFRTARNKPMNPTVCISCKCKACARCRFPSVPDAFALSLFRWGQSWAATHKTRWSVSFKKRERSQLQNVILRGVPGMNVRSLTKRFLHVLPNAKSTWTQNTAPTMALLLADVTFLVMPCCPRVTLGSSLAGTKLRFISLWGCPYSGSLSENK